VRLAVGSAAAWLAILGCLTGSPVRAAVVAIGGVAVAVAAVFLRAALPASTESASIVISRLRHRVLVPWWAAVRRAKARDLLPGVAVCGFAVAVVAVPLAGRLALARASPLVRLAEAHAAVTAELTVTADPRLLAATGVAGAPRAAIAAESRSVGTTRERWTVSGSVVVIAPATGWRGVLPGQRVQVSGTLAPSLDLGLLSVTMFVQAPPHLIGRPPWWQRAAGDVRSSLRAAAAGLPAQERGLLPGLIDGDTSQLDPVLAQRFRLAGLTHLVAVSGTNCSILVGALLLALRRMRVRPSICALAGAVVLVAFVVVARGSPSVLRAALMAVIALVSLATGRPRQALPALSAAVLGLLAWDPTLAVDAGFTMSVLATAALVIIAPGWADALRRRHVPLGVAEAVAVAAAAHLVSAPVIAAISGRVSVVAIPANVLAEPVVALTTVLGFGAAVLAPIWLAPAGVLAAAAGWPCRWLVWVADHLGGLPGAALPWPGGLTGGLALLAAIAVGWRLARRAGPARLLTVGVVVAALAQIPLRQVGAGWPPPHWIMVACDIGQGDGIVLPAGPQSAVVVDTGPDPVPMDRCLRDLGVTDVPLLVLTHYHLDHVGGIVGVLHERRVVRVVTGPLAEPASGVELVHAALAGRGLAISTVRAGQRLTVGRVRLDVLGPASAFHGTRSDPNNSSLVTRATIGGVRILLSADAEIEAQQAMLAAHVDVRADVLKVPHHGSAYFDPDFLAAVHAQVGVISVGLHNDYGHPSPLLLAELARLHIPVRRTDLDGDVAVVSTARGLATVERGVSASTIALGGESQRTVRQLAPGPDARRDPRRGRRPGRRPSRRHWRTGPGLVLAGDWSGGDARMSRWPPVRTAPTTCPSPCHRSCCSWAMRSCCWNGPSARSPPRRVGPPARPPRSSATAARSRGRSCTRPWARRCSATPASW
jgi:competence protein ComEC